jgi:hypothetical protein
MRDFLVNRDETGREIVTYPSTGKSYYVEYIEPRGFKGGNWGDIDPATNKVTGSYGNKTTGAIKASDSFITEGNGFKNIQEGKGSPYATIHEMHEKYKHSLKH